MQKLWKDAKKTPDSMWLLYESRNATKKAAILASTESRQEGKEVRLNLTTCGRKEGRSDGPVNFLLAQPYITNYKRTS